VKLTLASLDLEYFANLTIAKTRLDLIADKQVRVKFKAFDINNKGHQCGM
jgi:hypothetical protein